MRRFMQCTEIFNAGRLEIQKQKIHKANRDPIIGTSRERFLMKVKEIVKKYRVVSNASVIIQAVKTGDMIELTKQQIKYDEVPEYAMQMKVNSFEIIDNILTIYAE